MKARAKNNFLLLQFLKLINTFIKRAASLKILETLQAAFVNKVTLGNSINIPKNEFLDCLLYRVCFQRLDD